MQGTPSLPDADSTWRVAPRHGLNDAALAPHNLISRRTVQCVQHLSMRGYARLNSRSLRRRLNGVFESERAADAPGPFSVSTSESSSATRVSQRRSAAPAVDRQIAEHPAMLGRVRLDLVVDSAFVSASSSRAFISSGNDPSSIAPAT